MTQDSAAAVAVHVRVVLSRLRRRLRETYDRGDLTASQTAALGRLDKDGPAAVSELAVAEGVRPQSMAATVGVLLERELVDRRADPADGRRYEVFVTDAGSAFLEQRRRIGEGWLAEAINEQCTPDERRTIAEAMTVLDRIAQL